ncbi:MAG: hypothetical protein L3K14_04155 [Thermoplasmata archaeon]|nr:hypothetical protein [Thermoplasmata archaeon]
MALAKGVARVVALILVGLAFVVVGGTIWGVCASAPQVNGVAPNCGPGPAAVIALGILLILVGIGVGVASAYSGPRTIYPTMDPAIPPPLVRPVVVQETIVQQTVEVRCRYCGGLNPVTATKCSSCGAAL